MYRWFCLQLIEDFKCQYPLHVDRFFTKITSKAYDIIQFSRSKLRLASKHCGAAQGIRSCLELLEESADCTDDLARTQRESITALLLLPYLVALPGKGRAKSVKKLARADVVDSFICHVSTESDIEIQELGRRERGERQQPHIVYTGSSPFNPTKVFTIVDNIKYEQLDIVAVVDTTFKIFMSLNAQYPFPSFDVWLLIQIGFFEIKTPFDPKNLNQTLRSILLDLNMYMD